MIDQDKLSGRVLGQISERLRVPQKELMNLLLRNGQQKGGAGGQGIQFVNLDWVIDCFDRGQLVDDNDYLM